MTQSLYRDTLKKAWNITKNNTHLWFLGFLAALLGNGGEYEFVINQFNKISSGEWGFGGSLITTLGTGGGNFVSFIDKLFNRAPDNYIYLGVITFIILVIIWLVVSAQGALIKSIADSGKPLRPTLFEQLSASMKSFWPLVSIFISTRLWALFIIMIIGLPVVGLLFYVIEPLKAFFLVLFVIGVPIFVIASLITKYAIAYHMIDKKRWGNALVSALQLFFSHWLVSLEMAFVLFIVNILAGAGIILLILFIAVPFIILVGVLTQMAYVLLAQIILGIGMFVLFVVLIVFGSALATFQYASWTQLFLSITKNRQLSKIMRVIVGWREKYR
jgi:hypothetical protein